MTGFQGRFVWYDLTTTDVSAAIQFYQDVVGWRPARFDDAYTVWQAGDRGIGGVTSVHSGAKRATTAPHWMGYVLADDVDALTKKAESLGATTKVAPEDIPTIGRFSVIADPQGATIALFTPLPRPEPPPQPSSEAPPPGHVSWHELVTDDPEAALAFYARLVGWEKTDAIESPMGVYQMYGRNNQPLGGMFTKPADMPMPPNWLYYIRVSNVDEAAERVKALGGQVLNGPMDVPGGDRIAQCLDPQGAAFAVHSVAAPRAD